MTRYLMTADEHLTPLGMTLLAAWICMFVVLNGGAIIYGIRQWRGSVPPDYTHDESDWDGREYSGW